MNTPRLAFAIAVAAASACLPARGLQQSSTPGLDFLRSQGASAPSAIYREALDAFLTAEGAYWRKDYAGTQAVLDGLWRAHPPGAQEWAAAYREASSMQRSSGINIGSPPCYYALRMLTECVRWRLSDAGRQKPTSTAVLTVVVVGSAEGLIPTNTAELGRGEGRRVTRAIDPLILEDGSRVVHRSARLFCEYVAAASNGRLAVRTRVLNLSRLRVPAAVSGGARLYATLAGDAWASIWDAVPDTVRRDTDWWWVLYPSFVPEEYADFARTEFITGGMGTGPDGAAPCFIVDDRWLTRKPPHLGRGPYTEVERQAYLPQWLQHEFMHHLFRIYPQFGLEAADHQWFDRTTWPADFEGRIEPDYYAEALSKRIKPAGEPPLHVALKYAPPPKRLYAGLQLHSLAGVYRHEPVQNDWHVGSLALETVHGKPGLRWTNEAGKAWALRPDLANGLLRTGPDCPYFDANHPDASPFRVLLKRDQEGRWLPEVAGFAFNGGVYTKAAAGK